MSSAVFLENRVTTTILYLVPLALLFLIRQAIAWWYTREAIGGRRHGGGASVFLWHLCYVLILGSTVVGIVERVPGHVAPGWFVLLAGVALRGLAFRALGSMYSVFIEVRDRHRLIETGPYRFLRHPLHAGLVLEMLGLYSITPQWPAAVALAGAIAVLVVRNVAEDEHLTRELGEPYRAYRSRALDIVDLLPRKVGRR
jgi:protein-S-isoprenylcysteine O-methyltransferase Ste14